MIFDYRDYKKIGTSSSTLYSRYYWELVPDKSSEVQWNVSDSRPVASSPTHQDGFEVAL